MLLVHLFVCFVRVSFCHFSLPLGVGDRLRFVIVALFYKLFLKDCTIYGHGGHLGHVTLTI